jgi:hypothetical protein
LIYLVIHLRHRDSDILYSEEQDGAAHVIFDGPDSNLKQHRLLRAGRRRENRVGPQPNGNRGAMSRHFLVCGQRKFGCPARATRPRRLAASVASTDIRHSFERYRTQLHLTYINAGTVSAA